MWVFNVRRSHDLGPQVRLFRQPQRLGLVLGRLKGIELAESPTVTVLDSHIEVQPGWLQPIMARMKDNPSHVVFPMIDSIDQETLGFQAGGIGCTLGFLWSLVEHSIPIQAKDAVKLSA